MIEEAKALTADNKILNLIIAFNYGARSEITRAVRRLGAKVANGEIAAAHIAPEHIEAELDTAGIPDPDLLIRTSGELRLSNFLLWQCAYTELVFLDVYWPDFGREQLEDAIKEYLARDRRFGGLDARSLA
jgi:undecaprenyl diphosphate synthase